MRALERDRDRRFASAAEMARALDEFLVSSKLHIDDVAAFVRDIAGSAVHAAVAAPPGVVRRARAGSAGARRDARTVRARRAACGRGCGTPAACSPRGRAGRWRSESRSRSWARGPRSACTRPRRPISKIPAAAVGGATPAMLRQFSASGEQVPLDRICSVSFL